MADIVLVLKDQFSSKLNSVTNANKGLSKSMEDAQRKTEAYAKKMNALNSSVAKLQVQMQKAKKEVKEAEKAFAACADAANEEALTEAYQKYNALQESISDTRKSAKEARAELQKLNDEAAKKKGGSNGSRKRKSTAVLRCFHPKYFVRKGTSSTANSLPSRYCRMPASVWKVNCSL